MCSTNDDCCDVKGIFKHVCCENVRMHAKGKKQRLQSILIAFPSSQHSLVIELDNRLKSNSIERAFFLLAIKTVCGATSFGLLSVIWNKFFRFLKLPALYIGHIHSFCQFTLYHRSQLSSRRNMNVWTHITITFAIRRNVSTIQGANSLQSAYWLCKCKIHSHQQQCFTSIS